MKKRCRDQKFFIYWGVTSVPPHHGLAEQMGREGGKEKEDKRGQDEKRIGFTGAIFEFLGKKFGYCICAVLGAKCDSGKYQMSR